MGPREPGTTAVYFWYIYLLMYSNKLAYLELITVFVYGSSSPKSHEQSYLKILPWKILVNEFLFRAYGFNKKWAFS